MARLVKEIIGGEPYEYYPLGDHVVRAKGVCGGRPTFKYTRIEIAGILARLTTDSIDAIAEDYEGRISLEAIREAIEIACKLVRKVPKSSAA